MSLLRQLALGGLFVLTASSSGCICGGLALLGDHEDEPQCNETKAACQACCAKKEKTGGFLEHRRTRMNGARYVVCVCE